MLKLLIATQNSGKIREIQAFLADLKVELVTPADLGLRLDIPETGKTYAENAAIKARAFARETGLPSLADDSGLEVDALNGAPGLYSARYAPRPNATDADRRAYLLSQLTGKPRPWTARFHATVALTAPDGKIEYAHGSCSGEIIPVERGTDGFGYDPVFLLSELGRTMAELSMDEKNRRSHRARALANAREILQKYIVGNLA
ncbi:MAG: RdgB/HAM1 family non-canonical purine NTP pyrophosphatase [Anaerolineales bacterium]|nr:RdgB/HAM1 family non-canonical purine NTP pyrophosphatase [Anaerolineales bacterium]